MSDAAAPVEKPPADAALAQAAAQDPELHCVWWPTPDDVVKDMLWMARIRPDDVLYDMGCGDGRICIAAAAEYGIRSIGIERDPKLIAAAHEKIAAHPNPDVKRLVEIRDESFYEVDLSPATVVAVYVHTALLTTMIPQFRKLREGCRLVIHESPLDGFLYDRQLTIPLPGYQYWRYIYLYNAPLKPWVVTPPT